MHQQCDGRLPALREWDPGIDTIGPDLPFAQCRIAALQHRFSGHCMRRAYLAH
jgi:hypothetical protein